MKRRISRVNWRRAARTAAVALLYTIAAVFWLIALAARVAAGSSRAAATMAPKGRSR